MSLQTGAFPQVQKSGFLLAQTGASIVIPGFITAISCSIMTVEAFVNVISWVTPASFAVIVSYTDENGAGHSDNVSMTRGTTGAVSGTITAVDRWCGTWVGSTKPTGNFLVVTAGTFTGTVSYDFFASVTAVG